MITVSPRVVVLIFGVAAALGVVGCSSSTSREASTTAFPVVSTSPMSSTVSTSIPGSATTSPAATAAPTSAAPGTMPPSLSVLQTAVTAPPTTVVSITIPVTVPPIDPGAPPDTITKNINEVTAAVELSGDGFDACYQMPATCDPSTVYAPKSSGFEGLTRFIAAEDAKGHRLSTDMRGSYTVVEAVAFTSPTEATATTCIYDAGITLGPPGPDGTPQVVDDSISSRRTMELLAIVGGKWVETATTSIVQLGEGNKCPASY